MIPKSIREFDRLGASPIVRPFGPVADIRREEMPVKEKGSRFEVTVDRASGGFWVLDNDLRKFVDGPFRDREDAEARAAKRAIRDQ